MIMEVLSAASGFVDNFTKVDQIVNLSIFEAWTRQDVSFKNFDDMSINLF